MSPTKRGIFPLRWLKCLAAISIGGLISVALGSWLGLADEDPPGIRVRWRDGVSAARQAELARKYSLEGGEAPHPDAPLSLAYSLLDTSRRNIEAIVNDPEVADTNDIDRERYEVVGLRRANALWTLSFALLGMAIAAFFTVPALRKYMHHDPGDLFDRIPSVGTRIAWPSFIQQDSDVWRFLVKLAIGGMVVLAIGVPILETWEAIFLAVSVLVLVFGVPTPDWRRLGAAVALVMAVTAMKAVLPRADIAEAHNPFMVLNDGEPLEQGLPPAVFLHWKAQFDALYPPEAEPYIPYSWREQLISPSSLYTQSADAIWRKPKYTRQVDAIDFRTLAEFRGGFANEMHYNFWQGELSRESMPFYVMYELTAASVGSRLAWKGQVFWERPSGGFDEIIHESAATRIIGPEDSGSRVYAAFFPERDPQLFFRMEPSLTLRLSAWAEILLTLLGSAGVLVLTLRPRAGAFLRAGAICSIGYVLAAFFGRVGFLGKNYAPHGGGNDGLFHDGYGRAMAMLAGRGEIVEALQGGEAIYWFTPGMRYVRMVEKLLFGDTNHLYLLLIAGLPIVVFYLCRHFAGSRWAWLCTGLFCAIPVGNLSFLQNITNAGIGYGEAAGGGMFLLGLVLLLRTQSAWRGSHRSVSMTWMAGAALSAAMFIRPNLAIAVVWLGMAYAWTCLVRKDGPAVVALTLGLGLALWMPFHNWYYGGAFYLISESGVTITVPLGVMDYFMAASDLVQGSVSSEAVGTVARQMAGWLSGPGFVYDGQFLTMAWVAHAVKLLALIVTCWVVIRWVLGGFAKESGLAVVAVASICAHVPMLFIFSTHYRYAMTAWDLNLVVLLGWWALSVTRSSQSTIGRLPSRSAHGSILHP